MKKINIQNNEANRKIQDNEDLITSTRKSQEE